jgi:hypothetical protein
MTLLEFTGSLPSAAPLVADGGPIHSFASTADDCPVCGAPNGTCKGESNAGSQG